MTVPTNIEANETNYNRRLHHSLCWRAVLAGTIATIGIHLLLTALGVGAGLMIFRPMTDINPVATFSAGAAIVWSLFAIIAFSLGGWVAGRFSDCPRSGLMHGFLVWSLVLVVTLPMVVAGTGLLWSRAMKNRAEILRISSQAAATARDDLAKTAARRSHDQLASFIEEAVQSVPTNAAPKAGTRTQREVGFAVTKLFAPGNAAAFQANRDDAINALMVYTEMSAADATATIDGWITSRKNLQAELDKDKMEMNKLDAMAEQKASAAAAATADQSARHRSRAARFSFFTMLIGLLGASSGGMCGARCALRRVNLQRTSGTLV
jgi:hypothetical protein